MRGVLRLMIELSKLPAPAAGVFGGTVLLLFGVSFGRDLAVLSLLGWLVGQYITARSKAK